VQVGRHRCGGAELTALSPFLSPFLSVSLSLSFSLSLQVLYMTAQRWGSAMPAPTNTGERDAYGNGPETKTVMSVPYDGARSLALVPSGSAANTADDADFFSDDDIKLYYAGDFCSPRLPGVEAAALSAVCLMLFCLSSDSI
jgi:hypothetical protein